VRPVEYRSYTPIKSLLPELKGRYEARAEASPDFNYLLDQIERTRTLREREELSLNEVAVKADREANRRAEFDADNLRRFLKGLPTKEWVAEEPAAEDDDETLVDDETIIADADADAEDDEEEEVDPLLLESGRVLADFIELNLRSVSSIERQRRNL
jgi:carboxyl-terminal processing protease